MNLKRLFILFFPFILFAEGPVNTPEITIPSSKTVTEGNSGSKNVSIYIKIDECPQKADIKLKYYTKDGSATIDDHDYKAKSGTIVFKKKNCTKNKSITLTIYGDTKVEDKEKFYFKIADNGTDSAQPYTTKRTSTKIYINNDDSQEPKEIDLGIYKEGSVTGAHPNEEFFYNLWLWSNEPGNDKIVVKDKLPKNLKFVRLEYNHDDFSCSKSGKTIICNSKKEIKDIDTDTPITIYVKGKRTSRKYYTNKSEIHPKTLQESDDSDNYSNAKVRALKPGEKDEVNIEKSIKNPKKFYSVGDIITFRIKVTNIGIKKKIELRDFIPYNRGNYADTTGYAFRIKSFSVTSNATCEVDHEEPGKLDVFYCLSNKEFKDQESFTAYLTVELLKRGKLCNTAHAYDYPYIWKNSDEVCLQSFGNSAPYLRKKIPNQTRYIYSNIRTVRLNNYFKDRDKDPLTFSVSGLPPGVHFDGKDKIYGQVTKLGTYTISVTAIDSFGASTSTTFKITVKPRKCDARYDRYNINLNETLKDNVLENDRGSKIKVISHTNPKHGTLQIKENGDFIYTPNYNYSGKDYFKYTIKDEFNQTDTTSVQIKIATHYHASYTEFKIINPPDTRNVVGNYQIVGNTVTCITDSKNKFGAKCVDNKNFNNNNYMVRYIDIDKNDTTWNSSSSNLILPDFFNEDANDSILWAGLFWQGSVNNFYKEDNIQRRAYLKNGKITYTYIDENSPDIEIPKSGADQILLKVDSSSYIPIKASELYYDKAFGSKGGYYAAYANITNFLRALHLKQGKHTFMVANIVTNEGKETEIGDYAGWSIVVIYREKIFQAKPKNISIYGGYIALGEGNENALIKIKGFRLPKYGKINATLASFAGEGDYIYGSKATDYDKIVIKKTPSSYEYEMPGAEDPTNIFDSKLANVNRDNIKDNLLVNNNNGIDVDSYNVGSIMMQYRDKDPKINQVYLGIEVGAKNPKDIDYITPSMIGFATDLYAPKLCYDYAVIGDDFYHIPSNDRNITLNSSLTKNVTFKIMIRSQEADFDIVHAKEYLTFTPSSTPFKFDKAQSTEPNSNTYDDVTPIDASKGIIPIGANANENGGTIGAKERFYSKFYYKIVNNKNFNGKFDVNIEGDISFDGKNYIHYVLSTAAPKNSPNHIDRCPVNPVYNPVYGIFNVENAKANFTQDEATRYSLSTQVTGVPYKVSVASYTQDENGDFNKPQKRSMSVELELIDAFTFDNNNSLGYDSICEDPDTYKEGTFIHFHNQDRVLVEIPKDYPTYPFNLALKRAAFRIWYLIAKDNNNQEFVVKDNCQNQSDYACFSKIYQQYYSKATHCKDECLNGSGNSCYNCLRKYYGKPICSRDIFAIRPDGFVISIYDNNQSNSTNKNFIAQSFKNNNFAHLAAQYQYQLEVNATTYNNQDIAKGYYFDDENNNSATLIFNDSNTSCADTSSKKLDLLIYNGQTHQLPHTLVNVLEHDNSGKYKLSIIDSSWTQIDQAGNPFKPFKDHADCIKNSAKNEYGAYDAIRGCDIRSNYSNYHDLNLYFHPYSFDVSSINMITNPNSASPYVYMHDLTKNSNLIATSNVMALRLQGQILAKGYKGKVLTNYKNGCSAQNLDITIPMSYTPQNITDQNGNSLIAQESIFDSIVDSTPSISTFTPNNHKITFNKKYFYQQGIANFNDFINFKRAFNVPVNPFNFTVQNFSLSSLNDAMSVDLQNGYIPTGFKELNQTKTIYYAKVKSPSNFYDDITANSVTTPLEVDIFCNKNLDYCKNYGIDIDKGASSEYDWWVNINHSINEGVIDLVTHDSNLATISPMPVSSLNLGKAQNVLVQAQTTAKRPFTVFIKPTQNMINNAPWLLFNPFGNSIPKYIYKVRFVNPPGAWSGEGHTGYTSPYKGNNKKTKKVDW